MRGAAKQAARLKWAGKLPSAGVRSDDPEKAFVIFRIADHHLRQWRARIDRGERGGHQRFAIAVMLVPRQHRDRTDHNHRMRAARWISERDRPALDRADEHLILIKSCKR